MPALSRNQLPKPLKQILDDYPTAAQPNSAAWNVAAAATRVAHARGLDPNTDEFADVIRDQLDALPERAGGGGVKTPERTERVKIPKLTDAELDVAKFSGLSPEQYATAKKEVTAHGLLGRHGDGNRGY